jgi:hypothetical protein
MLTPEDKKLLIDFAGPLFAESKEIDSMYFNDARPKTDGMPDSGIARGIQQALERDFLSSPTPRRVQAPVQYPVEHIPQYVPEQMPQYPPNVQPQMVQHQVGQVQYNPDQMEFKFDQSQQEKTNTLLEAQNKLIKELIKKIDKVISLATNNDKIKD